MNSRLKLKHLAVATVAASLSGWAVAGDDMKDPATAEKGMTHAAPMEKKTPAFSVLDEDQDGMVSRAELSRAGDEQATQGLREKWSELDTDQDGNLDRSEFARFEPTTDEESASGHSTDDY